MAAYGSKKNVTCRNSHVRHTEWTNYKHYIHINRIYCVLPRILQILVKI